MKKALLEPASRVPYLMRVCLTRSSADLIGVNMRSTVKNAAKFAVYVEMRINVKNHHELPAIRPDKDLARQYVANCVYNAERRIFTSLLQPQTSYKRG